MLDSQQVGRIYSFALIFNGVNFAPSLRASHDFFKALLVTH